MAALILDEPTAGVDIEIRRGGALGMSSDTSPPGASAIREGTPRCRGP